MRQSHLVFPLLFIAGWAGLVILLTTSPGWNPIIRRVTRLTHGYAPAEALGHLLLFGILGLLVYAMLRRWWSYHVALPVMVLGTLFLGTLTEGLQYFTPGRAATLSDLLANWLGVFMAATVMSYLRRPQKRKT